MQWTGLNELREKYLSFFEGKGHLRLDSFPDGFSNKELQNALETSLKNTCEKFNELYSLTKDTIDDYNSYKSAQSIACISGVVAHKTASTVFYYAVGLVLALMFGFLICGVLVYIKKNETETAGK